MAADAQQKVTAVPTVRTDGNSALRRGNGRDRPRQQPVPRGSNTIRVTMAEAWDSGAGSMPT